MPFTIGNNLVRLFKKKINNKGSVDKPLLD